VFSILLALVGSTFFTRYLIHVSRFLGLLDHPVKRSIHNQPVSNAGGLALLITFTLVYLGSYAVSGSFCGLSLSESKHFVIGIFLFAAIGFYDDRQGMVASKKLLFQAIAAGLVLYFTPTLNNVSLPFVGVLELESWQVVIINLLWILLVVNAVNLIDGLDGLLALFSIIYLITIASIDYFVFQTGVYHFALFWAAAAAGFLVWNKPKANVFLGNCGSNLLGFIIAFLPLAGRYKTLSLVNYLPVFILLLYPLIDSFYAFIRRLKDRKNPFSGDLLHFHHLHFRTNKNGWKTLSFFLLVFLMNGIITVAISLFLEAGVILFVLAIVLNVGMLWSVTAKFIEKYPLLSKQVAMIELPDLKKKKSKNPQYKEIRDVDNLDDEIGSGCITNPD
jgi:UDP-GlcNAc:undecaprenyl-phosphate GlcNAc-1-phosphate transferase